MPPATGRGNAGLLGALAVPGLAFSAVVIWSFGYDEAGALLHDATRYVAMAREVAAGTFGPLLGREGGLFLDPGYPLVLAAWFRLFGPSVTAGMLLSATLWAGSAALFGGIVRRWLARRRALAAAAVFALSPALTSFAPKLFSEHLTCLGLLMALWGAVRLLGGPRGAAFMPVIALAAGMAILVLARATFFPLAVVAAIALALRACEEASSQALTICWRGGLLPAPRPQREVAGFTPPAAAPVARRLRGCVVSQALSRRWLPAAALASVVVLALPLHAEVQKGGRGVMAAAHQAAMVVHWPTPVALRCGVYSLSRSLGRRLFPEVEGACNPGRPSAAEPMAEINPLVASRRWLAEGFSMRDAAAIAVAHPGRYLLVCGVNLLGAVWIEGFYPQPLERLPDHTRTVLWLFKVALSTVLWSLAVRGLLRGARSPALRSHALAIAMPLAYVLAVQANFLGAQRYFFPIIPLLYLLAALGFTMPAAEAVDPRIRPRASVAAPAPRP
jgi:hypothetical protein